MSKFGVTPSLQSISTTSTTSATANHSLLHSSWVEYSATNPQGENEIQRLNNMFTRRAENLIPGLFYAFGIEKDDDYLTTPSLRHERIDTSAAPPLATGLHTFLNSFFNYLKESWNNYINGDSNKPSSSVTLSSNQEVSPQKVVDQFDPHETQPTPFNLQQPAPVYCESIIAKPNPLILLENHHDQSVKKFLIKNMSELKGLGYKKMLFEINSDVSIQKFKQQCQDVLTEDQNSFNLLLSNGERQNIKHLLALFNALEQAGIPYEFIDPQTQQEAGDMQHRANMATSLEAVKKVKDEFARSDAKRDRVMSERIKKEAQLMGGGVLFLGGNSHKELVKRLKAHSSQTYRVTIFSSYKEYPPQGRLEPGFDEYDWYHLGEPEFRKSYYQQEVIHLDNPSRLSFQEIATQVGLTEKQTILECITQEDKGVEESVDKISSAKLRK